VKFRDWPLGRVLLLAVCWVCLAGYLSLRDSAVFFTGSGPSGGLRGLSIAPRALLRGALITLLPPLLVFLFWRRAKP
jgi:hypothetical protein